MCPHVSSLILQGADGSAVGEQTNLQIEQANSCTTRFAAGTAAPSDGCSGLARDLIASCRLDRITRNREDREDPDLATKKGSTIMSDDSMDTSESTRKLREGVGLVFALGSLVVGLPAGVVGGAVGALNGRSFEEGFTNVVDTIANRAEKFGKDNAVAIKDATVSTVTGIVVAVATRQMTGSGKK